MAEAAVARGDQTPGHLELTRPNGESTREDRCAAAHNYADRGWPVFPLSPGTKVPALPKHLGGQGVLQATTDHAVIERMWARFPRANVGVATGERSGLAVLDIDPRHGGDASLAALVARHGELPAGPVAATPSGGRHYFMRWRGDLTNSVGRLGDGIDVRSTGGYVVAAPSVTPVGRYRWVVAPSTALAAWPDWLMPRTEPRIRDARAVATAPCDRVLDGLARTVAEAATGKRNDCLFWAACRLGEHAAAGRLTLDVGASALLDAARLAGLGDDEAHRTLASALRTVGAT